jgi:deoxycytidylate deaminase
MSRMSRISFDEMFFGMAEVAAKRADCTRRQIGAVIVWADRIWASGYNGPPSSGQPGCMDGACPRGQFTHEEYPGQNQGNHDYSNCISVHAEINAMHQFRWIREQLMVEFITINFGLDPVPYPVIYVTEKPCNACNWSLIRERMEIRWKGDGK